MPQDQPTGDASFEQEFGLQSNAEPAPGAAPRTVARETVSDEPLEDEGDLEQDEEQEQEEERESDEPEGDEEPDDELLTELKGMSKTERQLLLDALLRGEDADDLHLTYRANEQDRREPWAAVRRNAAGYFGQEKITEIAAGLKQERATFEEQKKAEMDRIATPMRDPVRFLDFIESVHQQPIDYLKKLAEVATQRVAEAEENPSLYQSRIQMRQTDRKVSTFEQKLDQVLQMLQGGGRPPAKGQPEEDGAEQKAQVEKEYNRRLDLVRSARLNPDKVGQAYEKAGFPPDFDRWFVGYVAGSKRVEPAAKANDERRKARVPSALRRRGGGTPPRRAPAASSDPWPSVDDVDKAIKATVSGVNRKR